MTEPERLLWTRIKNKQVNGITFYRQKPIGPYIVDFYGPAAKIVIEVDGLIHEQPAQRAQDENRDCYLRELGLTVFRFANHQVMQHIETVLKILSQQSPPL